MRFLSDENIGHGVIEPLRKLGFDVKSILEINPGLNDTNVLALANKENRILITSDKDFGELIYTRKLVHAGVILLRLKNNSSKHKLRVLKSLFKISNEELEKSFTVVKDNTVRIRK